MLDFGKAWDRKTDLSNNFLTLCVRMRFALAVLGAQVE
jgi:hypothetical protein